MGLWGVIWASVAFLAVQLGPFGMDSWFLWPLLGLGAALHLRHEIRKEVAASIAANNRKNAQQLAQLKAQPLIKAASQPINPPIAQAIEPVTVELELTLDEGVLAPPIQLRSEPIPSASKPRVQNDYIATPKAHQEPQASPVGGVSALIQRGIDWLLGGNTMVRVGVVVVFIGLAFLAKYTTQQGLLPIELRLSFIALCGLALLSFGFIKRKMMPNYALALQGGGVAVLYLTLLATMKGYGLLGMPITFSLIILVCAAGCLLALLQNSQALAVMSLAGGFAAPVLLSTGSGDYIGLFSYYMVLNLAILLIAYFKYWRALNLLGFLATFGVGTSWGLLSFTTENYLPTQLFLIGFFLIYLITALFYAKNAARQAAKTHLEFVDQTLVFGAPIIGFALQYGLIKHLPLGAAFSALILAFLYALLSMLLLNKIKQGKQHYRLLAESFIALSVGFITVTIPLALDGEFLAITWALQGTAAFWVGARQARWMSRLLGLVLYATSLAILLEPMTWAELSSPVLSTLIMAVLALILAVWLKKPLAHSNSSLAQTYSSVEPVLHPIFYVLGLLLIWLACATQIATLDQAGLLSRFADSTGDNALRLYLVAATALLLVFASMRWGRSIYAQADAAAYCILPVALCTFIVVTVSHSSQTVLADYGWAFWLLAFVLHYYSLYWADHHSELFTKSVRRFAHASSVYILLAVFGQSLYQVVHQSSLVTSAWQSVTFLFCATVCLILLTTWAGKVRNSWPLRDYSSVYLQAGAIPLVALIAWLATLLMLTSSGLAKPLPFIPIINPTDLTVLLGIGSLAVWFSSLRNHPQMQMFSSAISLRNFYVCMAVALFVWLNTAWLRTAHHYFDVTWQAEALFKSFAVQTGYAILWSTLALVLMLVAHRRLSRWIWMVGAALLALTVVKLVLIDLANHGGMERVIAFIVVGVMLLIIGYFAPIPPSTGDQHEA